MKAELEKNVKTKIAVIGLGYVGLANALLLSKKYEVIGLDIAQEKIKKLSSRISPLKDKEITEFLKTCNVKWTTNYKDVKEADLYIIATPTDYNESKNSFDTSSIESAIKKILKMNKVAKILIKSTIPVGYVLQVRKCFEYGDIYFAPEFLREGKALYDNLYPSRIVIGDKGKFGRDAADLYLNCVLNKPRVLLTNPTEAEAIKLFANTYLAMRVAYFNEIDTYSAIKGLDAEQIIRGVGLDPRIGTHYCNPSFGYGGYCLPKDTKQLLANYKDVPQDLICAIVNANKTRKEFIVSEILDKNLKVVGIYKLTMKSASDNFRQSAIQDILQDLSESDTEIIIYEPTMNKKEYFGCKVIDNIDEFMNSANIILANRSDQILESVKDKVYTRDIFYEN